MSDVVFCPPNVDCPCYARLTDTVAKQADEIDRLRAVLREIANRRDYQLPSSQDIARAALGEKA